MFKTAMISAVILAGLGSTEAMAQPKPTDFVNNYALTKVGRKAPADAKLTEPYLKQVAVGRIDKGGGYFELSGTMEMSDGTSINFTGDMRKGPDNTTWWHGVMSSAPNSDAQKKLPYSVTLVFYTQDFKKFNATVTVLTVNNAADFHQTGAAVWTFEKPEKK